MYVDHARRIQARTHAAGNQVQEWVATLPTQQKDEGHHYRSFQASKTSLEYLSKRSLLVLA